MLKELLAFEQVGFRYYAFGSLKRNGKKIATFYKADTLSAPMKEKLEQLIPGVFFANSCAQYAPEITGKLVCVPTRNFLRTRATNS